MGFIFHLFKANLAQESRASARCGRQTTCLSSPSSSPSSPLCPPPFPKATPGQSSIPSLNLGGASSQNLSGKPKTSCTLWWRFIPDRFSRQILVLKYFGTALVEEGPCSIDPAQHAPQGEPEGEPERGAFAEPEPGYPEPEPEPRFGNQLRAEPEPGVGSLRSRPEPEPEVRSSGVRPEPEPEIRRNPRFRLVASAEPEPEGRAYPEPEPESVRQVRTSRGSKVPQPEARSRDPSNKVYFIAS